MKKRKYAIYVLLSIAVIIGLPLGIDWLIIGNSFPSHISNSDWVGFLSGYIGSIVSMAGIIITIIYTNKQSKKDRENQVRPYCNVRFVPADKGVSTKTVLDRISIGCGEVHDNPDCYKCLLFVKNIGLGPAIEFEITIDDFDDGREHYLLFLQRTPQTVNAHVNSLQPGEESAVLLCVDFNFDSIPDEDVTSRFEEILGRNIFELSPNVCDKYKNYKLIIHIQYHDMYENVFEQKVVLQSEIHSLIDKDGHAKFIGGYRLDEKTIPRMIKA